MSYFVFGLFANLIFLPPSSFSAQIIGVFPMCIKSHHAIHLPIVKGLAARGHNVTILGCFKSSHSLKSYNELLIEDTVSYPFVDTLPINPEYISRWNSMTQYMLSMTEIERSNCKAILEHEYVQKMINSPGKIIDLIITEIDYSQCINLLAVKLDVPIICVKPPASPMGVDFMMGGYYTFMNDYMEDIAAKYFHMELPPIEELHRKLAMTFVNNHYSFISKATPSNVVNIAGIHIRDPNPLPEDIRKFIDEAEHGVIYFSFGMVVKASSMSIHQLNIFKNVFAKIPQRVLWKIDDPRLNDVTPNVRTSAWFPQRDILEHKNVKVFISHCGLLGVLESIHTATPIIGIPFLFDQEQNLNILKEKGMAIAVDYSTLTEEQLRSAIYEILSKLRYTQNAQIFSEVFRDRLVSPLHEALFWVENVIRHKGSPMLRSTAADMPIYQYLLLDVIALILFLSIFTIWVINLILKKIALIETEKDEFTTVKCKNT